jgi:hypothetical protein
MRVMSLFAAVMTVCLMASPAAAKSGSSGLQVVKRPAVVFVYGRFSVDGRQLFVLAQDFKFCDRRLNRRYTVPAGMITDFSSVPRRLDNAFSPRDLNTIASLVHDWGYVVAAPNRQKDADLLFGRTLMHEIPRFKGMAQEAGLHINREFEFVATFSDETWGRSFLDPYTLLPVDPPLPRPQLPWTNGCDGKEDATLT